MAFSVGDRVVLLTTEFSQLPAGTFGIVRVVKHPRYENSVGVEFEGAHVGGHDLNGTLALGSTNGWWTPSTHLKLQEEGKVVQHDDIKLPVGMTTAAAIEALKWKEKREKGEEKEIDVRYEFAGHPLDVAHAFHQALSKMYGWVDLTPVPGFFGDTPPVMVAVDVGKGHTVTVPWGRMQVAGIAGYLDQQVHPSGSKMILTGKIKKKDHQKVKELVAQTKEVLRTKSIYKHQAIRVSFEWQRLDRQFNPTDHGPKFLDLAQINDEDLVLDLDVWRTLNAGLFTPIEHSELLAAAQIPFHRGVLIEGHYGTGKTLTALLAAKKAVQSGLTFLYVENAVDWVRAMELALHYAPAVVFVEDIDRVTEDHTWSVEAVALILDGIESKSQQILTVVTTNNAEAIHPILLRPGRIDTVVSMQEPGLEATTRLLELYGRGQFHVDVDMALVAERLKGKTPAFIREIVERAKLLVVARVSLSGSREAGEVTEADLFAALEMMERHATLLARPFKKSPRSLYPEMLIRIPHGHELDNEVQTLLEKIQRIE